VSYSFSKPLLQLIGHRFVLGVIASPYQLSPSLIQPTTAYVLNDDDPNATVVRVQNNGYDHSAFKIRITRLHTHVILVMRGEQGQSSGFLK
jgi:hypothetical protein